MTNSSTVNTYSAQDVTLIIGGYQVRGWDRITIERTKEGFRPIQGIRSKHTRIPTGDTSANLSIALLQSSQSNEVLSYIHELDLEQGTGRLVITLNDKSGKSVFSTSEGYIVGYPQVVFSAQFEYRMWRIFCQSTNSYTVAGNTRPTTALFDGALNEASSFISNL